MTKQQAITEFITARLDEDEAAASLIAKYYPSPWEVYDRGWMARAYGPEPFWEVVRLEQGPWVDNDTPPLGEIIEHVARHDPDRVLREIETKRKIVAEHADGGYYVYDENYRSCETCGDCTVKWPCLTLRLLADIWSDHPDFREEWKL